MLFSFLSLRRYMKAMGTVVGQAGFLMESRGNIVKVRRCRLTQG
jgi:hypothetical protein